MRRREPVRPAEAEMPVELRRFDVDAFVRFVTEPEPTWWRANGNRYPWVRFKARQLCDRVRLVWEVEQGLGWWGATPERQARFLAAHGEALRVLDELTEVRA